MATILDTVTSPEDVKKLGPEELKQLASEIRERILTVVSKTGGHLASNLGAVELTLALHLVFDSPKDKFVFDVSHQSYTHKLLTGRNPRFDTLRTHQGISGFTRREESPHDPFGAGHASTSISAALGLATARDQKGEDFHVIAVIGDGSLTGGLAFEGLNNAGTSGRDLLVALNDNSMSISKNVGAVSRYLTDLLTDQTYNKLKTEIWRLTGKLKRASRIRSTVQSLEESIKGFLVPGVIFERLGFRYFGPIDGHNLEQLTKTLKQIKNLKGPILLHVFTIKGKGYKYAEEDATHFHGVGAFDKVTGNSNSIKASLSYSTVFGETLVRLAKEDKRLVAITAAMTTGTGLLKFAQRYPERFFDVGIAEQHAGIFAAGLAASGLKPFFAVYSTFLQRAFDQTIHDIALQKLPVVFAIDRSGIVGDDGPTHHGCFDLSYLRIIPNMVVIAPKDGGELRDSLKFAADWQEGPVAIRYPRGSAPDIDIDHELRPMELGSWQLLRPGGDLVILAVGSMVYPAVAAGEILEKDGFQAGVVNCRFVKPLDEKLLSEILSRNEHILTVEENSLAGGFGSAVSDFSRARDFGCKIHSLGIPDEFIPHGDRNLLLKKLGLDAEGIASFSLQLLSGAASVARASRQLRLTHPWSESP
jgi:1-deoxy-D-xylulose-5-phosphate synthase